MKPLQVVACVSFCTAFRFSSTLAANRKVKGSSDATDETSLRKGTGNTSSSSSSGRSERWERLLGNGYDCYEKDEWCLDSSQCCSGLLCDTANSFCYSELCSAEDDPCESRADCCPSLYCKTKMSSGGGDGGGKGGGGKKGKKEGMSGMCTCMKEGDHYCSNGYRPCCAGLTCSKRRECVSLGEAPSTSPSSPPSLSLTRSPSKVPSTAPSLRPTTSPSNSPSVNPSTEPSAEPTTSPSKSPSLNPSTEPSAEPTSLPSESASPSTPPCGGPCEDGDLCTINTCDIITNMCRTENVPCQEGEACDQFTGICQDVQNVVPCVAVIDEWDNRNYAAEWADFRSQYPQRPFCLLVPESRISTLPTGFDDDTVNNPDGIDRTIATLVNRDFGNVDLASDWFNACGLDLLSPASITFIGLFIDTSGSMTLGTVRASYDKFLVDIQAAGIAFDEVFNGFERWIDPFFTILSPPTFMPSGVALPTISPSTSVPMPMGSASPTMSPSIAPSTNLPSQSPSMAASDAPSIAPSNQPILEPPQEVLTLALSTGAITAGDSISIFPSLIKTTDGVPIDPLPAIVYQVTFVTGEASGTVPTVSSQAGIVLVETSDDTRGVYTLAATVDGTTTTTTTEIFLVLPPSSSSNSTRGTMSLIYNKLSTSVNGVVQTVDALAEAADKNDTDAIETALVALRAFRDDIVLDEIRQTAICAPEEGFL